MSLKLQKKPVEVEFRPEGYAVLESHHEEAFFMDWRRDPFPKILMFIGGEGILEMRDSRLAIRSPSVYVIPKGRKHRIVDSRGKPLSLYGICIHSPQYPSQALVRSACSKLRAENDPRRVQRIEGWLRQLLAEERLQPANFEDAQLCLITWILIELARTSSADTVQIPGSRHRVDAYISSLESEFWKTEDIDSVARTLGLSRRRLTQLFREISGESWQRRVTRLRMKYAGELLRTSSVSIRSIAFECGYKDLSHFYRVFRQYNGVSPGQYRKR
jgi:AraC family L-rhamnose operon regulatory protein RhaS